MRKHLVNCKVSKEKWGIIIFLFFILFVIYIPSHWEGCECGGLTRSSSSCCYAQSMGFFFFKKESLLLKSLFYWLLNCCVILDESLNLSEYLLRTWDNENHFKGVYGKTQAGNHVYVSRTASGISPIGANYFFCQPSSPTWIFNKAAVVGGWPGFLLQLLVTC